LLRVLVEVAKLHLHKEQKTLRFPCNCTLGKSHGLPCYHVIFRREQGSGLLEPSDFHFYWWYKVPESEIELERPIHERIEAQVLTPLIFKGKGRPKGSRGRGKQKGHGESSKYCQFSMELLY
jgi:hypothetical protein